MDRLVLIQFGRAAAIGLFALSLVLPTIGDCRPDGLVNEGPQLGIAWLTIGWIGALEGVVCWFANPAWVWAIVPTLRGRSPGWVPAFLAPVLGLSVFASPEFDYGDSPTAFHFCHPAGGLWVWLVALAIPLAVRLLLLFASAAD